MADQKLSALTALAAQPADDDEVYIRDVSEAAAAESKRITVANLIAGAGGAADFPMKLEPNLTRWVCPGWFWSGLSVRAPLSGYIYYVPIFVEETTTYIRIGINVTTGVSGTADLRIFNWVDGLPASLLLSAGTVDTTSTGAKEITISQELTRGYYFLAIRCSAGPTLQTLDSDKGVFAPVSGFYINGNLENPYVILRVDAVYNDPAPAPTSGIYMNRNWVVLREN